MNDEPTIKEIEKRWLPRTNRCKKLSQQFEVLIFGAREREDCEDVSILIQKVKELTADLRSGKNCCHPLCLSDKVQLTEKATKYFNACNDLNIRIIELKEGINRYLDDPEFETDILSKLIKEGR